MMSKILKSTAIVIDVDKQWKLMEHTFNKSPDYGLKRKKVLKIWSKELTE